MDVDWDTLERQADTKPQLQVFLVNTQWIKAVGSEQEIETKTQNFVRLKYKPSWGLCIECSGEGGILGSKGLNYWHKALAHGLRNEAVTGNSAGPLNKCFTQECSRCLREVLCRVRLPPICPA